MVEPFAAVLNSFRPGRATVAASPSSLARAFNGYTNHTRPSLVVNFFTPSPRSVKGKEKAANSFDGSYPGSVLQCQQWSFCVSRHSVNCPARHQLRMLDELSSTRAPRRKTNRLPNLRRKPFPKCFITDIGGQRRHTSQDSQASQSDTETPTPAEIPTEAAKEEAMIRLRWYAHKESDHFPDLEDAWNAYTIASNRDTLSCMKADDLYAFLEKLITSVERLAKGGLSSDEMDDWAYRIRTILDLPTLEVESISHRCLVVRSLALGGDVEEATSIIQMDPELRDKLVVYEAIISSISRYSDPLRLFKFLSESWSVIGPPLTWAPKPTDRSQRADITRSLYETVVKALCAVDQPALLLVESKTWEKFHRQHIVNFVIKVLCKSQPETALIVLNEAQRQGINTPATVQLHLVRQLALKDIFDPAIKLFDLFPYDPSNSFYLMVGLQLYSRLGDVTSAERYFQELQDGHRVAAFHQALLLHSYAKAQKHEDLRAAFDRIFPYGPEGKRLNGPTQFHYAAAVEGCSKDDDTDGILEWLEDMEVAGLKPTLSIYAKLLSCFVGRGDVVSAANVLEQMRDDGVMPDARCYTIVISLMARRQDHKWAEALYHRAISEGVVPDAIMMTSVMNAYVEAGEWQGVIDFFGRLTKNRQRRPGFTIDIFNTLLKAYVLIGAPFGLVAKLFLKLEGQESIRANPHTYALLAQSACDAGDLDAASDIYHECSRMVEEQGASEKLINVYILTIIMAGYLRKQDKEHAKAVYDEMIAKNLQPNAVTFGTIIRAYATEQTRESIELAEQFVQNLNIGSSEKKEWKIKSFGRRSWKDSIFLPLLAAYTKRGEVEDAERLYREIGDDTSPIAALTLLLDVYRRVSDTDAVLRVWSELYRLGLEHVHTGDIFKFNDTHSPPGTQITRVLGRPLSILIDALSTAGRHREVLEAWKDYEQQGLHFDSLSWNGLGVAFIRAGDLERAFGVIEDIIIPMRRQAEQLLVGLSRSDRTSLPLPDPSEPPLHIQAYRRRTVRIATARLLQYPEFEDDSINTKRYEQPLQDLQRIVPTFEIWRPHINLLRNMLLSVSTLESGRLVRPTTTTSPDYRPSDPEEGPQARQLLDRLFANYPNAIQLLLQFQMREQRRLGRNRYDRLYRWGSGST